MYIAVFPTFMCHPPQEKTLLDLAAEYDAAADEMEDELKRLKRSRPKDPEKRDRRTTLIRQYTDDLRVLRYRAAELRNYYEPAEKKFRNPYKCHHN